MFRLFGYCLGKDIQAIREQQETIKEQQARIEQKLDRLLKQATITTEDWNEVRRRLGGFTDKIDSAKQ